VTAEEAAPLFGGIDLGATKILSLVVSRTGSLLAEDIRPSLGAEGRDAVIGRMVASLRECLATVGVDGRQLAAIGVSAPGPVDDAAGVTNPPNLPGWHDVPLASLIGSQLNARCTLENDANAAAFAEHRWGAGRGSRHMLFLTVSSGVGGGIIIDGAIYRGVSGAAGEMGHVTIHENGRRCPCGRRGCLEAYSSGLAIAKQGYRIGRRASGALHARRAAAEPLTAKAIYELATAGDETARRLIADAGRHLGTGLASLINIFDPELIVLGGSLTKMGDLYLGPAQATVQRECSAQARRDVRIVIGELGDRAPALGVATLALETATQTSTL
jgi:glucokinase